MSNSNPQLKQYIREHLTNMYLELQESNAARRAATRAIKTRLGNVGGEGDVNATESGGRSDTPSRFGDTFAKRNSRRDQKSTPGPTVSSPAMIKAQTKNNDMLSSASAITSARGKDMLGRVAAKMGDQNAAIMADNTALSGQNAALTAAAQATPMGKWKMGIANTDSKLFGNAAQGEVAATKGLMGSGGKIGMGTKLAGGVAAAAMQGYNSADTEWNENKNKGMSDADNMGKTALRGTVAAAGAGLGTYGGMAAGAKLGSAIGPVGTLIGAAVGGLAGGYFGGKIADKGADMVTNIGDDDSKIATFRADREIEGIKNAGRIQKAKQDVADAGRTKGSGAVPTGGASDDGEDFEDNQTSTDGRQRQQVKFSSRGNGYGAGGNVNFDVNQSQRR